VLVWFVFLAQARWVAMRRYRMSWPNECDVLQYIRSTSNTTAAEEASNRARVVAMIAADGGDDEDENGLLDRWRHCVEVGLRDMGIHGIVENRIRRFDVFGYHSLCVTRVIEMIKSGEYVRRSCRVVFDYLDQIESGAADM
jgi:hypothetical protein